MRERPILFSAPMVRAILNGTKTQTRRVVKPQPPDGHSWSGWCVHSTHRANEGKATWAAGSGPHLVDVHRSACPYGQPGDRLWVREAWGRDTEDGVSFYRADLGLGGDADAWERGWLDGMPKYRWRPSIHMPRWASRITLEVTGVRVERLQDISELDAIAEGIERRDDFFGCPTWRVYGEPGDVVAPDDPVGSYRSLWEQINGPGSWDANPWVWCVNFQRV